LHAVDWNEAYQTGEFAKVVEFYARLAAYHNIIVEGFNPNGLALQLELELFFVGSSIHCFSLCAISQVQIVVI